MIRYKLHIPKILQLLVLITISIPQINAQITGEELFDIVNLYLEEHYDVVLTKLSNNGFELKNSTPDYSSNKIDYKGDFMMMQAYSCLNKIPPEYKEIRNSYIKFGTQNRMSEKTIQIEFDVIMPLAQNVFQSKVEQWEKEFGPGNYHTDNIGRRIAVFEDTNKYYGKDLEDRARLIRINQRSYIKVSYYNYDPNVLCNSGYTTLVGTLLFNIPKYPVENPDNYFQDLEKNKNFMTLPVKKDGNTYSVEISIGGKNIIYIIDSGASEMFISNSTVKYLTELGIIRSSDYLPVQTFILADGSKKDYSRIKIPTVKIGTIKVEAVEAAIVDDNSPLLLGKSFLDRFKNWKINNTNLTIELEY